MEMQGKTGMGSMTEREDRTGSRSQSKRDGERKNSSRLLGRGKFKGEE